MAAVGEGTQAVFAPVRGWAIFSTSIACIRSGAAHRSSNENTDGSDFINQYRTISRCPVPRRADVGKTARGGCGMFSRGSRGIVSANR